MSKPSSIPHVKQRFRERFGRELDWKTYCAIIEKVVNGPSIRIPQPPNRGRHGPIGHWEKYLVDVDGTEIVVVCNPRTKAIATVMKP